MTTLITENLLFLSQNSVCYTDIHLQTYTPKHKTYIVVTNDTHEPRISTPPEIAVGTHFYAQRGTKIISVFLPADEEASWLLLPSSVSKNTYSCILKVIGQV